MAYTWLPLFRELAGRFGKFRNDQVVLIEHLRSAGVSKGFTDEDAAGQAIPLDEIDPFTAFGAILKFSADRRVAILTNLKGSLNLTSSVPSDFEGVPSAQPFNFWFFPYKKGRASHQLDTLWALYKQCMAGELDATTFSSALNIPSVALAKLTQGLFWVNPQAFLPIDGQTRPFLTAKGIDSDVEDLSDYQKILDAVRSTLVIPFWEISHDAWVSNQPHPEEWQVRLTAGAIKNGYIPCGRRNEFFPEKYFGGDSDTDAAEVFELRLPDGEIIKTDIRGSGQSGRLRRRFGSLFVTLNIAAGDEALIQKIKEGEYELSFPKLGKPVTNQGPVESDKTREGHKKEIFVRKMPLNQILYGPPGTGKTHYTVNKALEILAPDFLREHQEDRPALKRRYDELSKVGRIRFVTFHQSFSYEDFVEGLRASNDDKGDLTYSVEDGVFKTLCEVAGARVTERSEVPIDLQNRNVWKMSLGNTQGDDAYIFQECIDKGYVLMGYGGEVDFSKSQSRADVQAQFKRNQEDLDVQDYPVAAVWTFLHGLKPGDLVVVSDGNMKFRAIGEVTGDYRVLHRDGIDDYGQCRDVRWIRTYSPSLPFEQLLNKQFVQRTLYQLHPGSLDVEKLSSLLSLPTEKGELRPFSPGQLIGREYEVLRVTPELLWLRKPNGGDLSIPWAVLEELVVHIKAGRITTEDIRKKQVFEKVKTNMEKYLVHGYQNILPLVIEKMLSQEEGGANRTTPNSWVLIIDEINRGNVSRILGELITLIEPSKRAGAPEALEVVLPYSKESFSVPGNLYIIGTMNTADRSLAGLDIALRRRFVFEEMLPRPELLAGISVEGIDIEALLTIINQRIEVLLDRDHCLGHAYFLSLSSDSSLAELAFIFQHQIVPMLQEYFFEDWERIRWVLNDHRKASLDDQFVVLQNIEKSRLLGDGTGIPNEGRQWRINSIAFTRMESYQGVIEASA